MNSEALGNLIAPINATLNLASLLLLIAGGFFIRRGEVDKHRALMLSAVTTSALFLILYVVRFFLTGTHRFAGEGIAKAVYLGILASHSVLAVLIVPLILRLLQLAFRKRFAEHRRLARWVYPLWIYVSVTGLTVYLLLYQIYGYQ